jgi:hypothetical protein
MYNHQIYYGKPTTKKEDRKILLLVARLTVFHKMVSSSYTKVELVYLIRFTIPPS